MGSHQLLIDDFCTAAYFGKLPTVHAWAAARYTIPGLLAPFAFNDPTTVIMAMGIASVCGIVGGLAVAVFFKKIGWKVRSFKM